MAGCKGELIVEAFLHYDQVASSYDQPQHGLFYGHLAEKLCILSKEYIRPKSVLDIGCGTGISTMEIIKHFPHAEVTALDRSSSMLARAQNKEDIKTAAFCCGQAIDLVVSDKEFDLIVSNMSFHWLSFEDRLVLKDALKEGGVLAISFPLVVPFQKKEGNSLLLNIFHKLKKGESGWRPFRGTRGLTWDKIKGSLPGLVPTHLEPYYMEEKFGKRSEFIEVLRVRGVFFALFGGKAALAEKYAREILPDNAVISYLWPLGMAIFGRDLK